jgi:ATP-dependent Clp protease ATP-binding subunit ClpA
VNINKLIEKPQEAVQDAGVQLDLFKFLDPAGVGKTELAQALAESLV